MTIRGYLHRHMKSMTIGMIMMSIMLMSMLKPISVQAEDSAILPHILFLSSYSYDWESVPAQIDGIQEVLGTEYYIDYLFMDSRNLGEELSYNITEAKVERFIKQGFRFDAVIAGDDAALHFVMDHWKECNFNELPVVFEGINDVELANKAASDYGMTGIIEAFPLKETIEAAEQIYPNATRVVAVVDNSISGKGSTEQYFSYKNDFPELEFDTINASELTEAEIKSQIAAVDTNTILLYLMCTENADGTVYMMDEAMSMAAKAANVPVFRADETGQSSGLFGGCLIQFKDMGVQSAAMVKEILDGKDISEVPVTTLKGVYQFNKDVLEQYHIRKSQLPKGAELVDYTPTFVEIYWTAIVVITVGALVALAIILLLIHTNKKVKKINVKLTETQETMNAAIAASDMTWFEYYPDRHIAFQHYGKNRWNLPIELRDYPDSYFTYGITHPEDEQILRDALCKMAQGAKHTECVIRNKYEQEYRWFKYDFVSIYEEIRKENKIVTMVMDISSDKEQEETRLELETAKRASLEKSKFLSNMSHDIRTPLNGIIGMTELTKSEDCSPVVMENLNIIDSSSHFLLSLINDILDISKIESGKLSLIEKPYALSEFDGMINSVIKPLMEKKKIEFVYRMNCGMNCAFVDPVRLNQIFFNLLSNSAKFTPEGGKVEFLAELVSSNDEMEWVQFIVKDNGIGMKPEFIPHAFDAFEQDPDANVKLQKQGTGLGLAIAKQLVELMGGTITLKSELGVGTTFTIELPLKRAQLPEKINEEQWHTEITNQLNGKKVLLVEDNHINLVIAERLLKAKGMIVDTAENGQEAFKKFVDSNKGEIQAILMDIRMPVMNGLEATEEIRNSHHPDAKTIPIIAMTANAVDEDVKECIRAGMNEHLSKPIEAEKMYGVLAGWIIKNIC